MSRFRIRPVVGVAVAAATLAACGTGTLNGSSANNSNVHGASPQAALLSAVTQAEHARSFDFSLSVRMTGGNSSALSSLSSFSISGSGAYSATEHAEEISVGSPSLDSLFGASAGNAAKELVFLRTGDVYIGLPGHTVPGTGKSWVEVSSSGLKKLGSAANADNPASYLQDIRPYVTSVSVVGQATVDGTSTTEYKVVENAQKLVGKLYQQEFASAFSSIFQSTGLPSSETSALRAGIDAGLKALPKSLSEHVYVDSSGRLRRLVASVPVGPLMVALFKSLLGAAGSSSSGVSGVSAAGELPSLESAFAGVNESVTMDVSNYATNVHIVRPPASEVISLNSLEQAIGSSASSASGSASASASASAIG